MIHLARHRLIVANFLSLVLLFGLSFDRLTLLGATPVFADEATQYNNVEVWVQPEFDEPKLLVMIEGKVAIKAGSTTTVRFLVPQDAEMFSAGSLDASGNYSGGPPNRKPSSIANFDEISYELTTDTFRVEYYEDAIRGISDKTINYEFRTLIPINGLQINVQQPSKATNFKLDPPAQNPPTQENTSGVNFNYFQYKFGTFSQENPFRLTINYTKTDSNPSLQPGTAPIQGTNTSNPSRTDLTLPLIVGGVIIVGLGAYWIGKGQSSSRSYEKPRYGKMSKKQRRAMNESTALPAQKGTRKPGTTQVIEKPRAQNRTEKSRMVTKARSCSFCRQLVEDDVQYCPYCGTELKG